MEGQMIMLRVAYFLNHIECIRNGCRVEIFYTYLYVDEMKIEKLLES